MYPWLKIFDFSKTIQDWILNQINIYCERYNIIENSILKAATVLDPRYKRLTFLEHDQQRKRWYAAAISVIEDSNIDILNKINKENDTDSDSFSDTDENEETSIHWKKNLMLIF